MATNDNKTPPVTAYFCLQDHSTSKIPENSLIIVPSNDRWNDFGMHVRTTLFIKADVADTVFSTDSMIGFYGHDGSDSSGTSRLRQLVLESRKQRTPVSKYHDFFTMLPDMESYRRIVLALGHTNACRFLLAANDIVAIKELKPSTKWVEQAISTRVFKLAFVRHAAAFFAFNNAGPILKGLQFEEIGNTSKKLELSFKLAGRKNSHSLVFEFGQGGDLPRRIAVVIGKNGVGKSQVLGRIARSLIKGKSNLIDGESRGKPVFNRILAFAPSAEALSVFPPNNQKNPRIWYQKFSLGRIATRMQKPSITNAIIQIARSRESIINSSRWKMFLRAIKAISSPEQICVYQTESNLSSISLHDIRVDGSEQGKLLHFASIDLNRDPMRSVDGMHFALSSGESSFIKFAAQACLSIENGSLILLDEPETHLHPNFIQRFVSLLDELLLSTGSLAILATHSSYFVREVFEDQVIVLSSNPNGVVSAENPVLKTFGADVGAISYFVFGEDDPSTLADKLKKSILLSDASWSTVSERYGGVCSLEFMNLLRSAIEKRGGS